MTALSEQCGTCRYWTDYYGWRGPRKGGLGRSDFMPLDGKCRRHAPSRPGSPSETLPVAPRNWWCGDWELTSDTVWLADLEKDESALAAAAIVAAAAAAEGGSE